MESAHRFEFSSGALCLDFSNTWADRSRPANDRLAGYGDLLEWGVQAGVVATEDRPEPSARSVAEAVYRRAVALREAIYGVFSATAACQEPAEEDLDVLNDELARSLAHLRLRKGGACCEWGWSVPEDSIDRMLWPVVRSAADLLTSDDVVRIRECASPSCSWLFVDTSRNGRRKWCDMATCGNRAKARRYYDRHRRKE